MLKRAITGTLFVTLLVVAYTWCFWSAYGISCIICLLAFREFYIILKDKGLKFNLFCWLLPIPVLIDSLPSINTDDDFEWLSLYFILIPIILISELYRNHKNPIHNLAVSIFSFIYSFLPIFIYLSAFNFETGEYKPSIALGYLILIWSNDTFAYLSGRFFGKNKLFERISPKKTWEGSIGGGLLTLGIAYVLSIFWTDLNLIQWGIIAVIAIVFGGLGDLVESMFKRSLNIKDSGNILPGHGGILDRFDAAMLGAPVLYFFISNCF